MKRKIMILGFIYISVLLTGCFEKRENPLLKKHVGAVAEWLYRNTNKNMELCAKSWEDPKKAIRSDLKKCKKIAANIADQMSYVGFSENVKPEDLDLPIVWREYNKKINPKKSNLQKYGENFSRKQKEKAERLGWEEPPF